ncbi:MAG: small multi-drug export protein [Actinobacteria bacterium]|nr:small multi-drug export protein [Actinomycetota bacterium]
MSYKELVVFVLSMLPVFERTTIPLGIVTYKMPPAVAFGWALAGNLVPVIPLMLLLDPAIRVLTRYVPATKRLVDWAFDRARRKHSKQMERYGALGIALLVSVPVPGFGPWTGVLLAYLFNVRPRYAVPAIFAGATVACVLLTAAATGAVWLGRILHGPTAIALSALFVLGVLFVLFRKKN